MSEEASARLPLPGTDGGSGYVTKNQQERRDALRNGPDPAKQARELLAYINEAEGYENYKLDRVQTIAKRVMDMELSDEAKRIFVEQQSHADLNYLDTTPTLADLLSEPPEPVVARIEDLMLVDHNTTVAAAAKTGKTTLLVNRVRTYVDGTPLFGRYPLVTPLEGNVGVFNYELSENQMTDWFRKVPPKNAHRVRVANLRGKGLFLQDDASCEAAIKWLKQNEVEIWEIDPLQAALRGTVNDDAVAGAWIANAEMVKHEAGVRDMVLTVHMGHAASLKDADAASERAIGSARWMGWPDNMWVYVKDPQNVRYLRAVGRDIDVAEFGLTFERSTFNLAYKGGDRKTGIKADIWTEIRNRLTSAREPVAHEKLLISKGESNKAKVRSVLNVLHAEGLVEKVKLPKDPSARGAAPSGWELTAVGRTYITEAVDLPEALASQFKF